MATSNGTVTLPIATYNNLRDTNTHLGLVNKELKDAIEELKAADGQKVIVHNINTYLDEDGDESFSEEDVYVKNFDDVKKEVEDNYKESIDDLKAKIKEQNELFIKQQKEIKSLKNNLRSAENALHEKESRNLWQRIWNK